jgi:putative pyruvate formate lyase activating enzyme
MKLKEKINKLNNTLSSCTLCPHRCRADRYSGKNGFCGAGADAVISSAMPHHGEEPPISGTGGSGTIFFSYCNMKCVYCQNWQISQEHEGGPVTVEELAEKMMALQKRGVHNINLVSPTIWIPQIVEALETACSQGFKLPLVYNTGGYDDPEIIKILDGVIDIYMPDMRYSSDSMGYKYSSVKNYVRYNRESVAEMYKQVGSLELDNRGIARRGLMIRLLVMPKDIAGIKDTIDFISRNLSNKVYLSIMAQYHPAYRAYDFPDLSRRVTYKEYREILDYAAGKGFEYGWTQDYKGLDPGKDFFIPDFKDKSVFKYYRR